MVSQIEKRFLPLFLFGREARELSSVIYMT
jgi:hypothetical protein